MAVGRLLGRVLSQRGLVANDARNRVAMYKGALRQRSSPSGPPLSTGSSGTGSRSGSNGVGVGISGTGNSSGSSSLHDRPLVNTSGGKLMVLYNSSDINSNNNNSLSPPVAACYDLNILIPTLYPDLDMPLPVGCPFFFPLCPSLLLPPPLFTFCEHRHTTSFYLVCKPPPL